VHKAADVEDAKAIVCDEAGQGRLAKNNGIALVKKEHSIPQREDKAERQKARLDAVETARNDVLEAETTATDEDGPMECNR